jgi:hypothetical protein
VRLGQTSVTTPKMKATAARIATARQSGTAITIIDRPPAGSTGSVALAGSSGHHAVALFSIVGTASESGLRCGRNVRDIACRTRNGPTVRK